MTDENAPLAPNEYRCAMCQQVYIKAWSDEEALAETGQYWPETPQEELAVVCDDCWHRVQPETHPQEYAASLAPFAFSEQDIRCMQTIGMTDRDLVRLAIKAFHIPPSLLGDVNDTNR